MPQERKTAMISVRLSSAMLTRLDFVANNTDTPGVKNRSTAVERALEAWLPGQEQRLVDLGVITKKAR